MTVILVHGAGGYGRLLAPIGLLLHKAGYEVLAPDMPGYGLSQVPGSMVHHARWVDCLTDLVHEEHRRSDGRPIVLFGASMGGYLCYQAAARSRQVVGVIATTLADPRLPMVKAQFARNRALKLGIPLMPVVSALFGRVRLPIKWFTRMDAMSHNPELTQHVLDDPIGGGNRVSVRFMASLFTMKPDIEPEEFDLCPVLLVHPGADAWTALGLSQPFFDKLKGPKELVVLDNCGHFPVEEPGITQLEEAVRDFLEKKGLLGRMIGLLE